MDLNGEEAISEVKRILKEKKCIFGTKISLKNLKLGKLEKIYLTENCPDEVKEDIAYYAKLANTEVCRLDIPNDELGTLCKKPFSISVIGVEK